MVHHSKCGGVKKQKSLYNTSYFANHVEKCRGPTKKNAHIVNVNKSILTDFLQHQSSNTSHWGRGGLETNENILSMLQALVEGTCHLPTNNRLGTFQMFPDHVFDLEPMGIFIQYLECKINMYTIFDPP